ncbi:MAG: LysM peptidoglycan-binding domain-containing protein [Clostridiaceae bacterium]
MKKNRKSPKHNVRVQIPERCRVGYQRYTVVSGDTMKSIAKRFNVSLEFLIAGNSHITDPRNIYPGDVLCVPVQPEPGEGRVPPSCPEGYERYTVKKGDTFSKIAQSIGVPIDLIIANNLHIPDPAVIFPGDVLCVPIPLNLPCCMILKPINLSIQNAFGSALVQRLKSGQHLLVITGFYLPDPGRLGNFDIYDGFVGIPGIGGYGFGLTAVPEEAGTWIGHITIQPLLSSGNQIYIIPGNSNTGVSGRPILTGILCNC